MYDYRKMTPAEKQAIQSRRERGFPLHAPPHLHGVAGEYLISTACYEHRPTFEQPEDISWLADEVLEALSKAHLPGTAWVFLPNHYHVLLQTEDLRIASEALRLLHSRVATAINGRQHQRGRRVWYRSSDRLIRSEHHPWAAVTAMPP